MHPVMRTREMAMSFRRSWWKLKDAPGAWLARSSKIRSEGGLTLYRSRQGVYYWLSSESWLQRKIIATGVVEPESTRVVERLVATDDVVLDIGANIGYFTLLLSRLVGERGRVLAFEPTRHYRNTLLRNLAENGVSNCRVEDCGLSNEEGELLASIGDSSATLHWVATDQEPRLRETIRLERLDDVVDRLELDRLDFVKIDIDGHEPLCLEGAWQTFERFRPIILLEVSAPQYLHAGTSAADFYDDLLNRGLHVYSEKNLEEYPSKSEFLAECGNLRYSANVVVSFDPVKGFAC